MFRKTILVSVILAVALGGLATSASAAHGPAVTDGQEAVVVDGDEPGPAFDGRGPGFCPKGQVGLGMCKPMAQNDPAMEDWTPPAYCIGDAGLGTCKPL